MLSNEVACYRRRKDANKAKNDQLENYLEIACQSIQETKEESLLNWQMNLEKKR